MWGAQSCTRQSSRIFGLERTRLTDASVAVCFDSVHPTYLETICVLSYVAQIWVVWRYFIFYHLWWWQYCAIRSKWIFYDARKDIGGKNIFNHRPTVASYFPVPLLLSPAPSTQGHKLLETVASRLRLCVEREREHRTHNKSAPKVSLCCQGDSSRRSNLLYFVKLRVRVNDWLTPGQVY